MQVSLIDAASFEKKLQEEVYEKWTENTEIIQMTRIPRGEIANFIDDLQKTLEGKCIIFFLLFNNDSELCS